MTSVQAVGVLLIALGLAYALVYAGWARERRMARPGAGKRRGRHRAPQQDDQAKRTT